MTTRKSDRSVWPLFVAVIMFAVVLRLYHLGHESLWIDEGNSLRDVQSQTIARQSKPLYYWLLSIWSNVFQSEAGLRLLAALFGVGCVIVVYLLGSRLRSVRAGLVAALLTAISPLHVNHSQEIRMYTLLTFCALLSTYFLYLMISSWNYRFAAGYIISTYLMLLTHPLTVFLLPAHGLFVLLYWRESKILVGRSIAIILLVFLMWTPWIPGVLRFGEHFVETQAWAQETEKLSPLHIPLLWGQFMYGEWNRLSYGDKLVLRYAHYFYAAAITLITLAVWYANRRRREMWLLGLWTVMPLILMVAMSTILDRSWPPRYLIYTSPPLFLILAWPVVKTPVRVLPVILAAFLLLPAARLSRYYVKTVHPEWRQAVRYVELRARNGDTVYIYKPSNRFVYTYYRQRPLRWKALGLPAPDGGFYNYPDHEPENIARAVKPSPAAWLLISKVNDSLPDDVEKQLIRQGYAVDHLKLEGINVLRIE